MLFLCELKTKGILVKHIDNPTFHLGLETSQQFLDKTKIALENLKLIAETKSLNNSDSKILSTYVLLKRFSLTFYVRFLFQKTEAIITANLISKKPSLFLFDLFK